MNDFDNMGTNLDWIPLKNQLCPIHHVSLSPHHIWISCGVAETIWQKFRAIWERVSTKSSPKPRTISELMILFAISSSSFKKIERRKWKILYEHVVWTLWKAYLSHKWGESIKLWSIKAAKTFYRNFVRKLITADRIKCFYEKYTDKNYNLEIFQNLWRESAKKFKVKDDLKILRETTLLKPYVFSTEENEGFEESGNLNEISNKSENSSRDESPK